MRLHPNERELAFKIDLATHPICDRCCSAADCYLIIGFDPVRKIFAYKYTSTLSMIHIVVDDFRIVAGSGLVWHHGHV
jgi:hypothetical protein